MGHRYATIKQLAREGRGLDREGAIRRRRIESNAHLKLSFDDIERREDLVFRELSTRAIPVAYAHGGGYASDETVARLHLLTARAAHRHHFMSGAETPTD